VREKLLVDIIEAEVLWGIKIRYLVFDLLKCVRKLEVAVEDEFRFRTLTDYQREHDQYYRRRFLEVHDMIYSRQPGIMIVEPDLEDKYAIELKEKIIAIDEYLRGYIDFD
jgi:hypothetical protein